MYLYPFSLVMSLTIKSIKKSTNCFFGNHPKLAVFLFKNQTPTFV